MEYTGQELMSWCETIEGAAKDFGLLFYPQEFEIIGHKEMIGYEAYVGMPSRYPHWSFGKSFERTESLYKYNLTGLPYEMVINSDPCLAYLMKDNTLLLQILTIAHVYGHNDFFKNNRLFKEGTRASYTLEMFKNNAGMVREYINDPSIGYDEVEKVLNAAHAVRFQVNRVVGIAKMPHPGVKNEASEDDLMGFIMAYGNLTEWQKNILNVVRKETLYFIPQIETKIMNEGWASYWHYKILNMLNLPNSLHIEFIKRHNDVIRPAMGRINPYHLGFEMYKDIEKRYGIEKIFEIRMLERDDSFIRRYLTKDLCHDLNLFQYIKEDDDYFVDEISDDSGWQKIRNTLCSNSGMGMMPDIKVDSISKHNNALVLNHIHEGRDLNSAYTEATLKHIYDLWGYPIQLNTKLKHKNIQYFCDDSKKVTLNYVG
ncbi:SpoVR family protein [Oxobacter pfennigii]|uniref:SpoVR family protein n=1 Tax=Oxobacter pfennigii TaxID=36849 RepID=A0A0P8WTV5_9CLOT|nr:SpoVR family protein [Oxobacter pfennigii]KPU46106.1 SpoVR family protein [Oxobacter pfennigii]